MKQWSFNPHEGDNAISSGDDIVMYINDIDPEVMAKIVEIQNNNLDDFSTGTFTTAVRDYVYNEDRCDNDQREFIMENITNFLKLSQVNLDEKIPSLGTIITQDEEKTPAEPVIGLTRGQRAAQTRRLNTEKKAGTNPVGTAKKATTSKAIQELQEKIELLTVLDSAEVLNIPSGLSVTGRNLMIEFQGEQDTLVKKYIDLVKQL